DDLAGDDEFRRRFNKESQAVAMLSHPNIVAVYDVSHSGNTEYIVMELIDGITLKQYMNRKGLLTWKEALHFSTQIAKALSHAHSRGIIHRDIKPHNIMILKDGSVKVADFGIARLLTVNNTLTQDALGSVHYISPEQAKGGYVDARSDIYSVGVVLYEMLTSRLPFVGDSAVSVAIQHISAIPLMPRDINPDIPAGLEDITMHAMEPDLSIRFTTADEMLNDLETFRKNPAIVFDYAISDPYDKYPDNDADRQVTKLIPPSALVKASRAPPAKQRVAKKPEMTGDEYRTAKRRASSNSTLIGIFSILVVIVIVVVFMWTFLLKDIFNPQEPQKITIPKFVGSKYEEVIRDGEYEELYDFTKTEEYSDDYPEGYIISQKPPSDRQQNAPVQGKKISVELFVSLGKQEEQPFEMPDLRSRHYSEAKNQLVNLGIDLEVEFDPVLSDSIAKDYVIETIPSVGGTLLRGNLVIVRYSLGPDIKWVPVPRNLEGKTRAELESVFETLNLIPDFKAFADETEEGTVTVVARAAEEVKEGTKIVVHISSGPPETVQPPEPDITETPTHEPPTTDLPTTDIPSVDPPTHEPPPTDTTTTPTDPTPTEEEDIRITPHF
ncbi:MAG: protein kinase, partial [Oscillospiraceae bacterium]|nr:protein kinase [Oscillospiraceae bacterium]